MSRAICAARIIGGNRWRLFSCRVSGSIRLCGLPIRWCAGTSSLPEKKAYSEALLTCSSNRKLVLACPVAFGETAVIQRVRNVLNYKRPRFWVILICIVVIVVTAIGFLTVPAKKDTSDPVGTIPVQDEVRVTESSKDAIEPVDTVPVQDEVNPTILPEAQQARR